MVSALWLSKRKWNCGMRRPAGRRIPSLMAPVFAVAVVHRARCTDSRMEQKLQMEISICSFLGFVCGTPAASHHQKWEERVGGFTVVGESLSGQIKALGMVAWLSNDA
jgi:hypothetical protein